MFRTTGNNHTVRNRQKIKKGLRNNQNLCVWLQVLAAAEQFQAYLSVLERLTDPLTSRPLAVDAKWDIQLLNILQGIIRR